MIDASHWKLRGRVRTLRSDTVEWDAGAQDWKPRSFFQFVGFDRDGRVVQLDQRGAEGSVFRTTYRYDADGRLLETEGGTTGAQPLHRVVYTYDETGRPLSVRETGEAGMEHVTHTTAYGDRGRRTTTHVLPPAIQKCDSFGIDGSDISYGAPGVTTITTIYDERDRSREVLFRDGSGGIIRSITLERDPDGRVVTEEAQNVGPFVIPDFPTEMSAEDRGKMQALAQHAFGTIRTTYDYDAGGRLISRTEQMGLLGEERIAYEYDERGNPIAEFHESVNREMQLNAHGGPTSGGDTTRLQDIQFSYEYDASGNWTKRIVRSRFARDAEFEPANSNMELRTIEYYDE
jgi:YD repeat-containing protein